MRSHNTIKYCLNMKTTRLLRHFSNLLDKKFKQRWTVHNQTNKCVFTNKTKLLNQFYRWVNFLIISKTTLKHTRFILTTMFKYKYVLTNLVC